MAESLFVMQLSSSLRRISYLAMLVSLSVGVLPPAVFFALEYRYQDAAIRTEAQINARLVSDMINRNPELWQFEQLRLEELLGYRPKDGNSIKEIREIFNISGHSVARSADALLHPLVRARSSVFNAGRVVGALEVTRSLRPALIDALAVALISLLLGAAVYFGVKTIPLRALRRAFADLEEEKERALITLQSIGDAVVTTDAQMRIQSLNPVAESLMGWTTIDARGKAIESVFEIFRDGTREAANNPVRECLERGAIVEMENHSILIRKTDGAEFHIEISAAPIRRATGEVIGAVMVFHDVSERNEVQKHLRHIAHHDALTGLPNRKLFHEKLDFAICRAREMQKTVVVLFLDLDHFKLVNDSLGHDIGDQLLLIAAKRLREEVRGTDTIARMGGDEFTAILNDIGTPEAAAGIAQKLIESIARPFAIAGQELFVTTSIGIAFYPKDGDSVDLLLKNADAAMYQAKDAGRNSYRCYTAVDNERMVERLHFESELRLALERNQFFIEYQPKLDLHASRIIGMEALIRWQSSTLGVVPPDRFISVLEESGQIIAVGEWVLHTALRQAREWADAGFPLTIAVNFSARQFREPNLFDMIEKELTASGLPAALLEIEVTESMLMQDCGTSEAQLGRLRAAGIQIAMDDFGTGYSSLSYLRRFPIDVLKIDKSFLQESYTGIASAAIVKTIIDLGHALEMTVIAEGVETADQCRALRQAGCDAIQGYWLSQPMPGPATLGWLASYQTDGRVSAQLR